MLKILRITRCGKALLFWEPICKYTVRSPR